MAMFNSIAKEQRINTLMYCSVVPLIGTAIRARGCHNGRIVLVADFLDDCSYVRLKEQLIRQL